MTLYEWGAGPVVVCFCDRRSQHHRQFSLIAAHGFNLRSQIKAVITEVLCAANGSQARISIGEYCRRVNLIKYGKGQATFSPVPRPQRINIDIVPDGANPWHPGTPSASW